MTRKKTVGDLDPTSLAGASVVVRADLNVPLEGGRVADDQRIRASIPTLELLIGAGARVAVLSHLGRPKGERRPELSLRPVAARLSELLGRDVVFDEEVPGGRGLADLPEGGVVLLENTRFHPGDTENDPDLAAAWASLADLFVNDAFGTAHRAHASTAGLARAVRARGGEAVAGLLMARELRFLRDSLRDPARPFVLVLGGAKISGKIDVIRALLPKVDRLLIGGAMANTFFRALGHETGGSLVEEDRVPVAREVLDAAGDRIGLPEDCVVAAELVEGTTTRTVARDAIEPGERVGDIGPRTRAVFRDAIEDARTIVWNGPMGMFEVPELAEGTFEIARAVADACEAGAVGIVGGGDSAAAAAEAGVLDRLTHVSTGGGASLELLSGAELPGVASLTDWEA